MSYAPDLQSVLVYRILHLSASTEDNRTPTNPNTSGILFMDRLTIDSS